MGQRESIFVQIVEVKIKQTSWFVDVLIIKRNKSVFDIEWNSRRVSINGNESAACLVIDGKITFYEVK